MGHGRANGVWPRCVGGGTDLRLSPTGVKRYDLRRGETLTITIKAALIEDAPR